MLILKTITHETIWGGNRLKPDSENKSIKIGHLYSLVSNGEFESEIINGELKGQFLKDFFEKNKTKYNLNHYEKFPFTISLTDATDSLSIQVHPDDNYAKNVLNLQNGKNESWYFIESPNNGKIYNGCKANSIEELKEKIEEEKYEDIIDYLQVESGDYVYVEAGTLHALSAGSLVYEIEENCNITYRLYDFDRLDNNGNMRQLQTEDALKTINVNLKSIAQKYNGEIKERLYSTKLFQNTREYTNRSNTIECLTILKGSSIIEDCKVEQGVTLILEPNEQVQLNISDFIVSRPIIKENE